MYRAEIRMGKASMDVVMDDENHAIQMKKMCECALEWCQVCAVCASTGSGSPKALGLISLS